MFGLGWAGLDVGCCFDPGWLDGTPLHVDDLICKLGVVSNKDHVFIKNPLAIRSLLVVSRRRSVRDVEHKAYKHSKHDRQCVLCTQGQEKTSCGTGFTAHAQH